VADDQLSATTRIDAPAQAIFAVLADPSTHAAIDGTGWIWRYDLSPAGPSNTTVTLTYDWSAVPDPIREHFGFPPFPPEHIADSLAHLAEQVAATTAELRD
jgi:hypothetical protein